MLIITILNFVVLYYKKYYEYLENLSNRFYLVEMKKKVIFIVKLLKARYIGKKVLMGSVILALFLIIKI